MMYVDFRSWNVRELIDAIRTSAYAKDWNVSTHWMHELVFDDKYHYRHPKGAFLYVRQEWQQTLKEYLRCPVVNFTHYSPRIQTPSVIPDGDAIAELGAHHLLELGLRNFAFVGDGRYYSEHRRKRFCKTIRSKRKRYPVKVHSISTPAPTGEQVFETIRWLRALPLPCGIMAATDPCALIISRLCDQEGISIPHDIALIGVNNAPEFCEVNEPEISSITMPYREMGRKGAVMLDCLMRGKKPEKRLLSIRRGIKVVARQSSQNIRCANNKEGRAIMFVRHNAMKENVHVEDVLEKFNLSRYSLEKAAQNLCGHSVTEEIIFVRNGRIKHLLKDEGLCVKEIAYETGFSSQSALCQFFIRHNNLSPSAWRKQQKAKTICKLTADIASQY